MGVERFLSIHPRCPEAGLPQLQPGGELKLSRSTVPVLPAVLKKRSPRRMRSPLVNVRTLLAVSVYVVIAQVFVALKNRTRPHTGERRFKCGHNKEHAL